MKYLIAVSFLFCSCFFSLSAQNNYSFRDRLFFGGNFGSGGLFVSDRYTNFEISPHVGYYITPAWSAGLGIIYEYYNNKYYPFTDQYGNLLGYDRFKTHIWGFRPFTNYVIVNDLHDWIPFLPNMRIFAHSEYEALSIERKAFDYHATGRELFHSVLYGGGLRFPSGRRSSTNLTILWKQNLSKSKSRENTVNDSRPVIRIGINF